MRLDPSHQIVLENFATFQKAQRCMDEVETYIQSILREIADELSGLHAPLYNFYFVAGSDTYLQTRAFPNWDNVGVHLITIGIERLSPANLLGTASPEATRAFIYSELLADPKRAPRYPRTSALLRRFTPPDGFLPAAPQMHGYLFVKQIAPIPLPIVLSRPDLKSLFRQHLDTLVAWLIAQAPHLAALAGAETATSAASV